MIIELEMLQGKLAILPDFPDGLKTLLELMIISHHGQYDFGSPKLPMFPEALMLHYLDDLDSKMEAMRAHFDRESELEGPWTSYNPSLARPLLNTKKFLERGLAGSRLVEVPKTAVAAAVNSAAQNGQSQESAADDTNNNDNRSANPAQPTAGGDGHAEEKPVESPFEALQRKFESHKPTPITEKPH